MGAAPRGLHGRADALAGAARRAARALHARWTAALDGLPEEAFARGYVHPASGPGTLDGLLASYAWHGRHHVAHVTALRAREGWDA